jgi:hypothetical protein
LITLHYSRAIASSSALPPQTHPASTEEQLLKSEYRELVGCVTGQFNPSTRHYQIGCQRVPKFSPTKLQASSPTPRIQQSCTAPTITPHTPKPPLHTKTQQGITRVQTPAVFRSQVSQVQVRCWVLPHCGTPCTYPTRNPRVFHGLFIVR